MKKRINLTVLTIAMALSFSSVLTSCSLTGSNSDNIWVTDGLTLVEQDEVFTGEKKQTMDISLAKAEYEGAQLQLYAEDKIIAYDVTVSDLYSENAVIPKEDISLSVEKYIELTAQASKKNPYGVGAKVPDALIPLETIKEYGENFVEKGLNQGIYVEVKTRENTAAGEYTGTITVTVNGVKHYIPLNVTVWDFVLPAQNDVMNFWGMFNWADWGGYEMDCSMEMAETYFEFLLDHRVCSDLIPHYGFDGAEAYVETLRKYWNHTGFNSYRFYYEYKYGVYDGIECWYDGDKLRKYLVAVAKASAEDKQNYLSKTYFYFSSVIDEPSSQEAFKKVELVAQATEAVIRDANEQAKVELVGTDGYGYYVENVEKTLLEIPNLITTNNGPYYPLVNGYDIDNMNFCISGGGLTSDPSIPKREQEKGKDIWAYTGMTSEFPQIDFGLESYRLQGRLIGWYLQEHNMAGYLNWAACIHNDSAGRNFFDPYTKDLVFGDTFTVGDGWIIYPGRPYEIYGPVGSIRLKSFRDAMEDNAYLQLFTELYAEKGLDAKSELDEYYDQLLYAEKALFLVCEDTAKFNSIRSALGERIAKLDSSDVYFGSATKNNNLVTISFAVSNEVTAVEYKGKTLTSQNGLYTLEVDLGETETLSLTLVKGQERITVSKKIVETFTLINDLNTLEKSIFKATAGSIIELNTDKTYSVEGNSLKVTLKGHETDNTFRPGIYFNIADLGVDISQVDDLCLSVYSENDELSFNIYVVGTGGEELVQSVTLQNGWNVITLNKAYYVIGEDIKSIRIRTPENISNPAGITFYIDHLSVTKKGGQ